MGFVLGLQYLESNIVCESEDSAPHLLKRINFHHLNVIFENQRCDCFKANQIVLGYFQPKNLNPSLQETLTAIDDLLEVLEDTEKK